MLNVREVREVFVAQKYKTNVIVWVAIVHSSLVRTTAGQPTQVLA